MEAYSDQLGKLNEWSTNTKASDILTWFVGIVYVNDFCNNIKLLDLQTKSLFIPIEIHQ